MSDENIYYNSVDFGRQTLVFDYRQEARGRGFNRAFCDILPYGLYSGGELVRKKDKPDTQIEVTPLTCIIKSNTKDTVIQDNEEVAVNDKVALRIETAIPQLISFDLTDSDDADTSRPYIVLRFGWRDLEKNFMEIRAVGWSDDLAGENDPDKLQAFDIILGKVLFEEIAGKNRIVAPPGKAFDLTRRQDVFIKETEVVAEQFRVTPTDPESKKVYISGGKVSTSKGRFLVNGGVFPLDDIPDTDELTSRTDLIVVDAKGKFKFIEGNPSTKKIASAPKYQNYKVLAEIRRGRNRSDILGTDIFQVTEATTHGTIAAEDFPILAKECYLPANAKNIQSAFDYLFNCVGEGREDETIMSLSNRITVLRNYVDSSIHYSEQEIQCLATDQPIFFAKMKKNSTAIFSLNIVGPLFDGSASGAVSMAISVKEVTNLEDAAMSILSTSIPLFFSKAKVYLATHMEGVPSQDYIFIGFNIDVSGNFKINMQAVSSEKNGVLDYAYSGSIIKPSDSTTFLVSNGYLAGYPVIKFTDDLKAFKKWDPNYKYKGNDPTFYKGNAYFANEFDLPCKGQNPEDFVDTKWILLARPDIGPEDIKEGAKTPQLFYQPGLIISNSTALELRKAHHDQGWEYPSTSAKVYHLDGDLFDQNQENELNIVKRTAGDGFDIEPVFLSDDSPPIDFISTDPAIQKKPFKEVPEFLYGTFSVPITMPDNTGQNILDYWFKVARGEGFKLISIVLPTGESFELNLKYEEPYWNDNAGVPFCGDPLCNDALCDNFPFNSDVLLSGTVPYNERIDIGDLVILQNINGQFIYIPFEIPNLPQPDQWVHVSFRILSDSLLVFINSHQQTISRVTSGFGGNTEITINPQKVAMALDEILWDWTTSITFVRFSNITKSVPRLPWAFREWDDGWLTLYADNTNKVDSNLVEYFFPVGSVIVQAENTAGNYDPFQVPWKKFNCFKEEQFENLGEVTPVGGTANLKTKLWKRVS